MIYLFLLINNISIVICAFFNFYKKFLSYEITFDILGKIPLRMRTISYIYFFWNTEIYTWIFIRYVYFGYTKRLRL